MEMLKAVLKKLCGLEKAKATYTVPIFLNDIDKTMVVLSRSIFRDHAHNIEINVAYPPSHHLT